jgi:SagB-type dehydrogenase family enzyme
MQADDQKQLEFGRRCLGKDTMPPVFVTLQANFARMQWKYQAMAYATILKDAGAIIQTMYLAAQEVSLGVCPIGTGDTAWSATLTDAPWWDASSVCELLIGAETERYD